ncbi:MAG: hypothetical protein Q9192_003714, partial [Flavoplaca navasiana]
MAIKRLLQCWVSIALNVYSTDGNPVGPLPGAGSTDQQALKTLVTTVTDQGSAYTLTYQPTTIAAATTLVDGTSTTAIDAGAVVGIVAGGAAVAALPLAIPKAVPQPILEGDSPTPGGEDDSENTGCEEKTAKVCTEDCSADWFVSSKKVQTTLKCSTATCADTTGCTVADTTKTNSQTISVGSVVTYTTSTASGLATAAPLNYAVIQVYLGKEYLRLHIDGKGDNANSEAECGKDPAKGILKKEGLKDNVADFCKSNYDIAASPNTPLLVTYNQDENRMQVVLQVSYTGRRGQGAIYTVNEKKCNEVFSKILTCGPDKDHTFGGKITSEKGVYSIEPYTYPGKLECAPGGGKYGVFQDEALANIDDFCTKFDGQQISQGESKDNRYFQREGGRLSKISVSWEPGSIGCEQGGPFDHGYHINKAACKRFLGQTISDCNTDKKYFKAAGVNTDQCARYQLSVESRETVICGSDPRYSDAQRALWHPFDPEAGYDAIETFCGKNLLADPSFVDKTGGFSQFGDWPEGLAKGGKRPVTITAKFLEESDFCGTDTPANKAFKTGGFTCRQKLRGIIDGCDTARDVQKKGGYMIES